MATGSAAAISSSGRRRQRCRFPKAAENSAGTGNFPPANKFCSLLPKPRAGLCSLSCVLAGIPFPNTPGPAAATQRE